MNPNMDYPRLIKRTVPPHFLTQFHAMEENWQMTEELMAEIERADYALVMSQQISGISVGHEKDAIIPPPTQHSDIQPACGHFPGHEHEPASPCQ